MESDQPPVPIKPDQPTDSAQSQQSHVSQPPPHNPEKLPCHDSTDDNKQPELPARKRKQSGSDSNGPNLSPPSGKNGTPSISIHQTKRLKVDMNMPATSQDQAAQQQQSSGHSQSAASLPDSSEEEEQNTPQQSDAAAGSHIQEILVTDKDESLQQLVEEAPQQEEAQRRTPDDEEYPKPVRHEEARNEATQHPPAFKTVCHKNCWIKRIAISASGVTRADDFLHFIVAIQDENHTQLRPQDVDFSRLIIKFCKLPNINRRILKPADILHTKHGWMIRQKTNRAGLYELRVTLDEKDLKGSPRIVDVLPKPLQDLNL